MSRLDNKPAGLPVDNPSTSFWHSQPSPLLTGHRSTRNLPSNADVVIIGSGITGTSVAHHLLPRNGSSQTDRKNLSVVMLDAREACSGATGRNGGHCQPITYEHPEEPSIGHFELANFHAIQNLVRDRNIDCEFVEQYCVRAVYSKQQMRKVETDVEKLKQTAPELAKRTTVVKADTPEGKARLRELRLGTGIVGVTGALVNNLAGRMWPYKFVAAMLEDLLKCSDLDGKFNLQTLTPALSISPSTSNSSKGTPRWTVKTPRGDISTRHVVLATNAYTSHLIPNFSDLIVPCRGQMSALHPLPSLQGEKRLQTSFNFEGQGMDDYLIQRPFERGGHLMFGGGRQNGPSMGIVDDSEVDPHIALYLRRRLVPALDLPEKKQSHKGGFLRGPTELEPSHEWTGIMGYSRDDLPWVGPVPEHPGVYMSAGYTGHGMPNAWLCGKSVAMAIQAAGSEGVEPGDQDFLKGVMIGTGLPRPYLIGKERIERARKMETVAQRDWAEMARATEAERERPHSGYA